MVISTRVPLLVKVNVWGTKDTLLNLYRHTMILVYLSVWNSNLHFTYHLLANNLSEYSGDKKVAEHSETPRESYIKGSLNFPQIQIRIFTIYACHVYRLPNRVSLENLLHLFYICHEHFLSNKTTASMKNKREKQTLKMYHP